MDKQTRTVLISGLITTVIGLGIIILVVAASPKSNGQGYGLLFELAGIMLGEFLTMLITGLILVSNVKTKPVGRGVFLGMLITMVVGFGICTSS